eukprot:9504169-Pyramimonas_sp.AAC.3
MLQSKVMRFCDRRYSASTLTIHPPTHHPRLRISSDAQSGGGASECRRRGALLGERGKGCHIRALPLGDG